MNTSFLKNILIIQIFLFAFSSFLFGGGGKIVGTIVEQGTGDPLIGVNVIVEELSIGAATDSDGNYVILNIPAGMYSIKASYIGYSTTRIQEVRVSIDQTTWQNISMSQEAIKGQEVIVTAQRGMVQKDLTASQKTTSAEEIKVMPVESFLGVLTTQAGVNEGHDGALHIRGGRSNEVGYYIDGVAISNPFFTNSLAINVSNQALEEMKVVSGAFNAEYGNAMSGIVNLQIKEGSKNYHGNFTTYTGDYISNDTDIYSNIDDISFSARQVYEGSLNGPVPFLSMDGKFTFNITGKYFDNEGYYFGVKEHHPSDLAYFGRDGIWIWQMGGWENQPFAQQLYKNEEGQWVDYYTEQKYSEDDFKLVPMHPSTGNNYLLKLTYKFTPRMKLSGQVLHGGSKYKDYVHAYKYNPGGVSTQETNNDNYSLKFNHAIGSKSFYEAHVFYGTTDYMLYYADPIDLNDALSAVDPGNDKDFYIVATEDDSGATLYELYNHSFYETQRIFGVPSSAAFVFGGTQREQRYRQSNSRGGKIDFTSQVTHRHEMKTGISYRIDDLDERYFEILFDGNKYDVPTILPENSSSSHSRYNKKAYFLSSYVQDKLEYENFVMNVGLRYDYFDPNSTYIADLLNPRGERKQAKPKQMFSPRIGVALPITDEGIFHFSYGHFYQMPTLRLMFIEPIFGVSGSPTVGYADVRPEKTVSYEFGLQQQLSNILAIETNIFYKDIRDLLALQSIKYKGPEGPQSYSVYQNKDYGAIKGFTFSLTKNYDPITKLSAFFDYTYQATEGNAVASGSFFLNAISGLEKEKDIVPLKWDQSHIINVTTTFSEPGKWSFSLISKLSSGWPYTPNYPKYTDLQNINPDENSGRKPWQKTFDLLVNKSVRFGGVSVGLFAKTYNVLDTQNEAYVFDDTGRSGYTFIGRSSEETEFYKSHYGEPGIHTWEEYQTRPSYYRSPRLVTIGFSINI